MADAINLIRLFNSAPKDEKNTFIQDPRTDKFYEALSKATPLTPPQLLELAAAYAKPRTPAADMLARSLVLQAIADMGHERRVLEILSRVKDEQTSWGLSVRDLIGKITETHRTLSPHFTIGTLGGGGVFGPQHDLTVSVATTPVGSGCTYQPPAGPAVTLAPKQTLWFYGTYELGPIGPTLSNIQVMCFNGSFLVITTFTYTR